MANRRGLLPVLPWLLLLSALAPPACTDRPPCRPGTAFLTFDLSGFRGRVQVLEIDATAGTATHHEVIQGLGGSLNTTVQIGFPQGYQAGGTLHIDARVTDREGTELGSGLAADQTLASGCTAWDLTVPAPPWQKSCVPLTPLVSDLEDGLFYYGTICPVGAWFLTTNGAGMAMPGYGGVDPVDVTDRPGSGNTKAIHVQGSGQKHVDAVSFDSFANISASLNTLSDKEIGSVDASAYEGIKFSAKVAGPLAVYLSDAFTHPAGNMCDVVPGRARSCLAHPNVPLAPSATWTEYKIPFASLVSPMFGNQSPLGAMFPRDALFEIGFEVLVPDYPAAADAWDIWIDDLAFYLPGQ